MSLAPRGARTEHDQRDQGGKEGLRTWISASGKEREWIGQAPMGKEGVTTGPRKAAPARST
jgi:hypothetical protein